mmetsp:Transcript_48030/g.159182  ORF Transcript_48030/g.159182 Transcript_48030/m.159182 type:complete len:340 (+) Transcript_48030:2584-3603(+)
MSRVLVQRLVDRPPPTVGIEARGPTVAAARRGHGASRALAGGEQAGALREAWRKCLLSRPLLLERLGEARMRNLPPARLAVLPLLPRLGATWQAGGPAARRLPHHLRTERRLRVVLRLARRLGGCREPPLPLPLAMLVETLRRRLGALTSPLGRRRTSGRARRTGRAGQAPPELPLPMLLPTRRLGMQPRVDGLLARTAARGEAPARLRDVGRAPLVCPPLRLLLAARPLPRPDRVAAPPEGLLQQRLCASAGTAALCLSMRDGIQRRGGCRRRGRLPSPPRTARPAPARMGRQEATLPTRPPRCLVVRERGASRDCVRCLRRRCCRSLGCTQRFLRAR